MTATSQDCAVIEVGERFDRASVAGVLSEVDRQLVAARPVILDLGRVESFDSAGIGTVVSGLRRARAAGHSVQLRGLSPAMLDFFSLVSVEAVLEADQGGENPRGFVERLGAAVDPILGGCRSVVVVSRDALRAIGGRPWRRGAVRLDRLGLELDHAAGGALPIVALIAFLLGLILAMQAYVQLRVWGAEIYMADMVGVSVITEIGPLMTAIVLAARSGSSNAAQLGSMVVGEEVDALEQMGIDPLRYLVVPKVVALSLAVVGLGILFDVIALCGGALFASAAADIELAAYAEQTRSALAVSDVLIASVKSLVFGATVGLVGCALGLRVSGGSEGVGRATTNAVVVGIFLVIVIDAVFVTVQRLVAG